MKNVVHQICTYWTCKGHRDVINYRNRQNQWCCQFLKPRFIPTYKNDAYLDAVVGQRGQRVLMLQGMYAHSCTLALHNKTTSHKRPNIYSEIYKPKLAWEPIKTYVTNTQQEIFQCNAQRYNEFDEEKPRGKSSCSEKRHQLKAEKEPVKATGCINNENYQQNKLSKKDWVQ